MNGPSTEPVSVPAAKAAAGKSQETASRARVLLVDDDPRNLIAMGSVLEDLAEIVTASSGEAALRELLNGDFAMILLDVIMPGMDGYETATLIRGREQTKRIPIVFLSAVNKDSQHLTRGYSMGAVDYVFKPVESVVLRSKVAVFVDLYNMAREIEEKASHEQHLLDDNLRANAELLSIEKELRLAEQRQASIIETLPIVLYMEKAGAKDRMLELVGGNSAAMTVFKPEAGAQEEIWLNRVHADDRIRVAEAVAGRAGSGEMVVEYRWRDADGHYRYILDHAVRMQDAGETGEIYAGTLLDISDRKSLENQLLQAQKMDALGKMTGGIAHDFNNLLAAVLGGIGLIERRLPLTDEQKKITQMTRHAADQGVELVKRLLAFSRRQHLEPAPVDLRRLSGTVSELLEQTLGGLVKLQWSVDGEVWPAYADETQLELAVLNLIINARDAMPGGGTVAVSAENRTLADGNDHHLTAGDYVVLTVADSGTGMTEEIMAKVMEPFFTTKEIGKGTGLGLSMVYGFARQSNGTVDIESQVGKGTSVHIWLPRSVTKVSETAEADESLPSDREQGEPLRVLLVDDHESVRHVTTAMLEDLGHQVKPLASGAEMLACLDDTPKEYDIIISDYAMPLQSGGEAIEDARRIRSDIAGLIITGHADESVLTCLPDRTVLLTKPFTVRKFAQAITESMQMARDEPPSSVAAVG